MASILQCHNLYPDYGYWLSDEEIRTIEKERNSKFIGHWFLKDYNGNYDSRYEEPMDFFYTLDKDKNPSKKSHYFGVYKTEEGQFFIDAMKTFSEPMKGVVTNNSVYIPLYKQEVKYLQIDKIVDIKVINGQFIIVGDSEERLD